MVKESYNSISSWTWQSLVDSEKKETQWLQWGWTGNEYGKMTRPRRLPAREESRCGVGWVSWECSGELGLGQVMRNWRTNEDSQRASCFLIKGIMFPIGWRCIDGVCTTKGLRWCPGVTTTREWRRSLHYTEEETVGSSHSLELPLEEWRSWRCQQKQNGQA